MMTLCGTVLFVKPDGDSKGVGVMALLLLQSNPFVCAVLPHALGAVLSGGTGTALG